MVHGVPARPVLGLDIGGSWTRALVVDPDSAARLGAGRRAGANPVTHGVARASAQISAAVRDALADAGVPAGAIAACTVGLAGASKLAADPAAARAVEALWREAGIGCEVEIVADVTTAFVAGCAEPQGSVLLAGTGAIAAAMTDRRPADLRGGHGWMLGDEGSGYWIGREAVRATLAALDDGVPLTGLTAAVLARQIAAHEPEAAADDAEPEAAAVAVASRAAPAAAAEPSLSPRPTAGTAIAVPNPPGASDFGLDDGRRLGSRLIAAANARPAVELARLVPLVAEAADQGDRTASGILHAAAELLVATLARARGPQESTPVVLAGGVLGPGTLVYRLVLAAVAEAWPKARVTAGVDGTGGAAWLAARRLLGDGPAAADLHARLLPPPQPGRV
jgi:N-acetylglucosamine kinase-like BadF-type ATPase